MASGFVSFRRVVMVAPFRIGSPLIIERLRIFPNPISRIRLVIRCCAGDSVSKVFAIMFDTLCGGRQFVSDHFNDSDLEVGIFSEDDMFFQNNPNETCRNGFNRYTPNLYQKCLEILQKENFDMLKLNFSEFYGDSSTCWAWYNVPQDVRQSLWPDKPRLPVQGLDPNAPLTEFKNIKSHKGLPYVTGNIYYSNWTHFITKKGNRKMFQDTKFQHPFENTWMSYIYQETIKGK